MSSVETIVRLASVTESQWGYLTTQQALGVGVSRDQIAKLRQAGVLESVEHGVHRLIGAPAPVHEDVYVNFLALRDRAVQVGDVPALVVGGKSAARLHDMGDYWPGRVELITQAPLRTSRRTVKLTRLPLDWEDVTSVNGLPVLIGNATLRELIREGGDLSLVAGALMDGLHTGAVDLRTLEAVVDEVAPGCGYASGHELVVALVEDMPMPRSAREWYLSAVSSELVGA